MNKYLLFSFMCYYPTGGMADCIYVADSIEELNDYAKEYIKKQGYPDDFMEYYDVQKNEMYMADCALLKQGIIEWELEEDWLKEWYYDSKTNMR